MNVNPHGAAFAEPAASWLGREGLSSRVYQHIRQQVMRGRFQPGEKLKLRDLAAELGVSPTPVREALARLVSESALEQVDHRSVRVPLLSKDIFREMAELRLDLEGRAAERAAGRASADEIDLLIRLQDRFVTARVNNDVQGIIAANEQFHLQLCAMSKMTVLTQLVEGLWLRCGPVFRFISAVTPLHEPHEHPHHDVILGLQQRDAVLAKIAIQRDIMTFAHKALGNIERINAVVSKV